MGNGMVAVMVDSMMVSTGKCNHGRKNEAPQVNCLAV